jgi:uncharacterized membrane protein
MGITLRMQSWKLYVVSLFFLTSSLWLLVLFDIPVARQVFGFLFLIVVPGTIISQVLNLSDLDRVEALIISVGLSIAFLMISGLALNGLSEFGLSEPLQSTFFMIILSSLSVIGGIIAYRKKEYPKLFNFSDLKRTLLIMLPAGLVLLTVLGTFLVNAYSINTVLIIALGAIASVFVALVAWRKSASSAVLTVAIYAMALSLLYHSSLISPFVFSSDAPLEISIFAEVFENKFWNPSNPYPGLIYGRFHAMLSITMVPTVFLNILNFDPSFFFKVAYPILFALVPVCLYQLWKKYIGAKYAFIAAFFFMAQQTFYTEMLGLNRQMIAELFFALLLLIILSDKIKPLSKTVLFLVFSFGLVTSHYGLSLIFFFFAASTLVYTYITKQNKSKFTVISVLSFSVVMFVWYVFSSGSTVFGSILEFSDYVVSRFGDFFNPASRGQTILLGLGLGGSSNLINLFSRIFAYITQLFIVLGFISLFTKRANHHFHKDYLILTAIAAVSLGALIIVPGLADTLNMTRFYHILLFFLAPLCVLGAAFIVNSITKQKLAKLRKFLIYGLLLTVLVPYFAFQTNLMYEVAGEDSWSVPLSKHRMDPARLYSNFGYIDLHSVHGAVWVSRVGDFSNLTLYSDAASLYNVLTSYGLIYRGSMIQLTNLSLVRTGDFVYLGSLNTQESIVMSEGRLWNISELSFDLTDLNKVYVNGKSEVYQSP